MKPIEQVIAELQNGVQMMGIAPKHRGFREEFTRVAIAHVPALIAYIRALEQQVSDMRDERVDYQFALARAECSKKCALIEREPMYYQCAASDMWECEHCGEMVETDSAEDYVKDSRYCMHCGQQHTRLVYHPDDQIFEEGEEG